MDLFFIKKHLEEDWLNKQIEIIESKKWIEDGKNRKVDIKNIGYFILEQIEKLLKKFEDVEGFSQWVIEAKTSKDNFEDLFFELLVLENLFKKSEKFILKPENKISGFYLDAVLEKEKILSYIECTKLKGIPKNICGKVTNLFHKSTKKFMGGQGIHFLGVFDFFEYHGGIENPSPKLRYLIKIIQERFKRNFGKSTLAFVVTNIFVSYNPDLNKSFVQKKYFLVLNPLKTKEIPKAFFEKIFEVNEFIIL